MSHEHEHAKRMARKQDNPEWALLEAKLHRVPYAGGAVSEAERTVRSIAAMLGWTNVPPQHVLEAEIRALKARAKADPASPQALRELIARWRKYYPKSHLHSADDVYVGQVMAILRCADELEAVLTARAGDSTQE